MDVESFLEDPQSRRDFFRGSGVAVAGGSAVFLAACGDDEPAARVGPGDGLTEVAILNAALGLENMAVAAYTTGAGKLRGDVLTVGRQLLDQEKEHADALVQAIKQLGATPNKPKPAYDFPELSDQTDVLRFANDLENTAVAAYVDALPKLQDPKLRGTASAILTNEAEHISVLLGALGRPQVPQAFVTGTG